MVRLSADPAQAPSWVLADASGALLAETPDPGAAAADDAAATDDGMAAGAAPDPAAQLARLAVGRQVALLVPAGEVAAAR